MLFKPRSEPKAAATELRHYPDKQLKPSQTKGETHMPGPNPGEGGDIIIKGGSVDLFYNEDVYGRDSSDPQRHTNADQKITRVVITGDISFDSGDYPEGLHCTIKTICS
jgi:hypothetical protein